MVTYQCDKFSMAVNTTCAKCDVTVVDARQKIGDCKGVQIAKCPSVESTIKFSSCCGEQMTCNIQILMKLNTVNSAKPRATFHRVLAF